MEEAAASIPIPIMTWVLTARDRRKIAADARDAASSVGLSPHQWSRWRRGREGRELNEDLLMIAGPVWAGELVARDGLSDAERERLARRAWRTARAHGISAEQWRREHDRWGSSADCSMLANPAGMAARLKENPA